MSTSRAISLGSALTEAESWCTELTEYRNVSMATVAMPNMRPLVEDAICSINIVRMSLLPPAHAHGMSSYNPGRGGHVRTAVLQRVVAGAGSRYRRKMTVEHSS